ncbi:MAG: hypothetical protein QG641_1590 [Candidatus Poribacteria bacterium]|nr:hypothetical protein [Candidatus Poribacteria bacterium]
MTGKFYFDFRDIFRAGRMGFKGKKMFMHFLGLIFGYIVYEVLTYVSLINSDVISSFWRTYGLCPVFLISWKSSIILPLPTIIMMIIGAIVWIIIYLLFNTAVSKVAIEELRGDDFYSMKGAFKFAFKNAKSIYVTILGLIGIFLFCLLLPSLVGIFDLIPKIELVAKHFGTPLTAFLTIIVYFLGLFMVLTIIACLFGLLLIPAIIAVTGEDTFETIYQLYSTIWNQPWRLFIYNKLVWFVAILGFSIFAVISIIGLYIAYLPSMVLARQDTFYFADVIARALKIINVSYLVNTSSALNPMPWTLDLATFFMFVSFIMIIAIIIAYPLSVMSCGYTIIYVILRKKTTDENMLELSQEEPVEEQTTQSDEQKAEESTENKA